MKSCEYQQVNLFEEALTHAIDTGLKLENKSHQYVKDFILYQLCCDCGGLNLHIPKTYHKFRDDLIRAEFNGRNVPQLAVKYRLSMQWIYKILKHEAGK